MATWTAADDQGHTIGEYASKSAMFDDLYNRLGIGGQFRAMSSLGACYAYEITEYGFRVAAKNVPTALHCEAKTEQSGRTQ